MIRFILSAVWTIKGRKPLSLSLLVFVILFLFFIRADKTLTESLLRLVANWLLGS